MGCARVGYRNQPPSPHTTAVDYLIKLNVLSSSGEKLDERGLTSDEREIMDEAAEKIAGVSASAKYLY